MNLPKGAPEKAFINELTTLTNKWSSKSPNQGICLKSLMVIPFLILQKTSNKSITLDIKSHVERRLELWKIKDVEGLLNEARSIQKMLSQQQKPQTTEGKVKIFAKLVLEGKINGAIRPLDDDTSYGVLPLLANGIKTLCQKYPDARLSNNSMMLHGPFIHVKKIIFDEVNAELVRKCAIKSKGSHEPSGRGTNFWSKILCNSTFGNISDDLCHDIALN